MPTQGVGTYACIGSICHSSVPSVLSFALRLLDGTCVYVCVCVRVWVGLIVLCGCVAVWLCGCVVVWRVTVKEEVSEFHARRRHIRLYRLHLSLLCPHGAVIRSQDALSQRKRGSVVVALSSLLISTRSFESTGVQDALSQRKRRSAVVSAVIPLNQHSLFRIDRQYDEQHFHTQRAIENYCLIILSPPPPKKRKASDPSGNYRLVIHSHEKN
jgi:hypothetical protein